MFVQHHIHHSGEQIFSDIDRSPMLRSTQFAQVAHDSKGKDTFPLNQFFDVYVYPQEKMRMVTALSYAKTPATVM
jgi:hypothetical protein